MLERINDAIMKLADPVLNRLLALPPDLALIFVAVGTGALIAFSRLFTTNQDLLRRCDGDRKRLRELIREAKARKDGEAVKRHRATVGLVGMTAMRQEGWPLLVALVPIAFLGTWCFQRMAFVPPRAGETVPVRAWFPVSAVGELAHMVPHDGLREVSVSGAGNGGRWIREIAPDIDPGTGAATGGVAMWSVQAEAGPDPHKLLIRYRGHTAEKEMLVGRRTYSPPVQYFPGDSPVRCVELGMRQFRPFGIVLGIGFLGMPPWLVAYFLVAIPCVSLIKKLARIH